MPAAWVAAAGAVIGGISQASASGGAANTQAQAAQQASATQSAAYNQMRSDVTPWWNAGQTALSYLMAGVQDGKTGSLDVQPYQNFTQQQFQQDPGYQFQMQQGQNALQNQASVSGGMNSNNLKGLLGYSQGLANSDYQTALNNYMSQFQLGNQTRQQQANFLGGISQGGYGAALQQGQVGVNVANSIGNNIIGAGNTSAAGQVGAANAISGGISNAYNAYLQQQYLNPSSSYAPTTGANNIYLTGQNDPVP